VSAQYFGADVRFVLMKVNRGVIQRGFDLRADLASLLRRGSVT